MALAVFVPSLLLSFHSSDFDRWLQIDGFDSCLRFFLALVFKLDAFIPGTDLLYGMSSLLLGMVYTFPSRYKAGNR